jgi:hypothetical protein
MIVCHEYRYIFLKSRKTAGTSVEIALAKFCGPRDVITRISRKDERTRRGLGYRGAQNFWIPITDYTGADWRKLLTSGQPAFLRNHLPAEVVRGRIGAEVWDSYYKISIERNPWDKAISLYYWFTRTMPERPSLLEFLNMPQFQNALSNYAIYSIDGAVAADHVIRYENLDAEIEQLAARLKLPGKLDLPHAKASVRPERRHYSQVISPQERDYIAGACAKEIALFRYEF